MTVIFQTTHFVPFWLYIYIYMYIILYCEKPLAIFVISGQPTDFFNQGTVMTKQQRGVCVIRVFIFIV